MAVEKKAPRINNKTIRRSFRVDADENQRINDYCDRTGESNSDLFRKAIAAYIGGRKMNE